jgi:hypothetical protein
MDLNRDFHDGFKQIEDYLKAIKPDITELEITLVKIQCKSLVHHTILSIGNHITTKTNDIKI